MKWTIEKINKKKEYFREQREHPTGKFVVRTYFYISNRCNDNENKMVESKITNERQLVNYVYEGIYDEPDHMAHEVIDDCVRNLKEMGYIGFKKINAKWYIYIKNNLDFLLPSEKEKYVKEYGYEK